jgi:hypothetical protein
MAKPLDWPFLRVKCVLCGHRNCPECREVSCSILACCKCRARAVKRLHELHELQNKEEDKE